MLIIPQIIKVKWNSRNKKIYEKFGYKWTFKGDSFEIDVTELPLGSEISVEYFCDYCNKVFMKIYKDYNIQRKSIGKDACKKCSNLKRDETNELFYGVKNTSQLNNIIQKIKDTNIEKYGVEHYSQTEEYKTRYKKTCNEKYGVDNVFQDENIKNRIKKGNLEKYGVEYFFQSEDAAMKIKKTMLEKYGVDNAQKSDEIKKKMKSTMLEKYGVDNYSKTEEYKLKFIQTNLNRLGVSHPMKSISVRKKVIETNIERYGFPISTQNAVVQNKMKETFRKNLGVDNPMQNVEIKNKFRESLFKNGNAPCSIQQLYVCEEVKGILNYPVGGCSLDIAFPDEKIYIEYDGGGHDLCVKFGTMTQEEFNKKEIRRSYYLRSLGWKVIRLISSKDKLPTEDILMDLIKMGISKLKEEKIHWCFINIDTQKLTTYFDSEDFKLEEYYSYYSLVKKMRERELYAI